MVDILLNEAVVTNTEDSATDAEDIFVMPTSYVQQRLWFLQQLDPETSHAEHSGCHALNRGR